MKIGRRGAALFAAAALASSVAAGCAHRHGDETLAAADGVSVDIHSLWKKEASADPITAYKLRLSSDPDNPGLHNNLGNQYVLHNQMKEALREFHVAARLDHRSPVPWNNIGTTYKKLGKLGQALGAFNKAVSIDERYALAYYNLGTVYDEKDDYDRAIEYYLRAVALKPELTEVKQNPQVVENKNLMVVKLRHWLEESGNIALPLDRLPE